MAHILHELKDFVLENNLKWDGPNNEDFIKKLYTFKTKEYLSSNDLNLLKDLIISQIREDEDEEESYEEIYEEEYEEESEEEYEVLRARRGASAVTVTRLRAIQEMIRTQGYQDYVIV